MQKQKKQKKRGMITLLLAALALGCTLFLFAPGEQYLLNQTEGDIWFNLSDILPMMTLAFVLCTAALLALGRLLPAKARRVFTALVLALAVCLYLQGNFLNPDYGALDGRAVRWSDYTLYAVLDTAFWLAVPAALVWLALKRRRAFRTLARAVAGGMLIIQAVTLVAVIAAHPPQNKRAQWFVSDKDQFALGTEQNTVVFVVDACDTTYIPAIQREAPDALAALDGFTYYSDYAGAYSKTKMGLLYTLTQQWYENDETVEDYITRAYDGVPLYAALAQADWDARVYTADMYMSPHMVGAFSNVIAAEETVRAPLGLFGQMMRFSAYRYAPHLLKPALVFYSGDFELYKAARGDDQPYLKDNFVFRGALERQRLRLQAGNAFVVYHINGSHLPCNMDASGRNVGNWNTTALEQTKGVLRTIITPYLEQMKALGVYDSANIVITADHGRFDEGPSSPVMLLKPAYAHGELAESVVMAGVSDLHATLMKLCGFSCEGEALYEIPADAQRVRRYLYYPTTRANGGTLPPLTEYRVERGQQFVETGVVLPGGKGALEAGK